jgi:hypothetical protein
VAGALGVPPANEMLSRDGERVIEAIALAALLALALGSRIDFGIDSEVPRTSSPSAARTTTALPAALDPNAQARATKRSTSSHRNRMRLELPGPFELLGARVGARITEISAFGTGRPTTRRC